MKILATIATIGLHGILITNVVHAQSRPIKDALANNDTALVMNLLKQGADIYEYDSTYGTDNLITSCRYGNHPEKVSFLLRHGAKPDKNKSPKGRTALHVACAYYGCVNTVKLLVDAGANVNAQTTDGTTPLMLAAQNAKAEVVEYLLSKGAKADLKDSKSQTAFDYAYKSKDDEETKKWSVCPIDKNQTMSLLSK